MEENYDNLMFILERSIEKNGEKPLTNKWLLNILKQVEKHQDNEFGGCSIFDTF